MIEQRNLITLPLTCYGQGFEVSSKHNIKQTEITYSNIYITTDPLLKIKRDIDVESIINNKDTKMYINLDVRKNIKLDCNLLSGEVQALQCPYYILSHQDFLYTDTLTVRNFLDVKYFRKDYDVALELIKEAMEFDIIDEQDFILIPERTGNRWESTNEFWHHRGRKDKSSFRAATAPKDKIVLHLSEVLPYTNNTTITSEDVVKLGRMLETTENCKVALTLMNTVNPYKSLPELLCLCNYIPAAIRKEAKIAVLPLLYGAYGVLDENRNVDIMVKIYEEVMGKASIEVLEKFADSYYNSRREKSSIYDFKLKLKKNG